jgi:hypothetical protein
MAHLITQASPWLLSLCVWVGMAYAIALYFFGNSKESWSTPFKFLLASMRFIVVSLLVLMLFQPLLETIETRVEKPVVVLALDNSQSIVSAKDSNFIQTEFLNSWKGIAEKLGSEYEVIPLLFGDNVSDGNDATFSDQITHFGKLQRAIDARFSGRNLSALVIASDGLYNKGPHPVSNLKQLNIPVFTVGLGDTTLHRDLLISNVSANKIAYLGNNFPIRLNLEGRKAKGNSTVVSVSKNGVQLASQNVSFTSEREFKNVEFSLPADQVGIHAYTVTIQAIGNEDNLRNNTELVYIEVIDNRQKILILANAPHPDITAIAEAMRLQENYEVTVQTVDQFTDNVNKFDMLIAYQIPSLGGRGNNVVQEAYKSKIPCWFILGAQNDFNAFNAFGSGFSLNGYQSKLSDISASLNPAFSYFSLSNEFTQALPLLPPLAVPFGNYSVAPEVQALLTQRIGKIATDVPLLGFGGTPEHRIAVLCGEGIWRWKVGLFQMEENHDVFNQFITQTTQFIGVKENKEKFRIQHKKNFAENELVYFNAELYDESFTPVLNQQVNMELKFPDNNVQSFAFSPSNTGYQLNAGMLPPGAYSYTAKAFNGTTEFMKSGGFTVNNISVETARTIADFQLLEQLSSSTNGKRFNATSIDDLVNEIRNRKEITSVSFEEKKVRELIDWAPLLVALLSLLSIEWFLRKWNGSY